MTIQLGQEVSTPAAAASRLGVHYAADGLLKAVTPTSEVQVLTSRVASNLLINSGLWLAQRQASGTLTTYSATADRAFCADQWALTNENASVQYQRVDTSAAPETGYGARYYGAIKKITSAGKVVWSQAIEGSEVMPYRGRKVRLQLKAKDSVGTHTLRLALLQLSSAGTMDSIPATFVSAFGAASVDPTWGTALAAIAPSFTSANGLIVGSGINCPLSSSWKKFGGVFTVPSDCKNLVAVVFSDQQLAANDIVHVGEFGFHDGEDERDFIPASLHDEISRCLRHCSKTFALDTAPAQAIGNATGELRYIAMAAGATTERSGTHAFPVTMRIAPTVTTYNTASANANPRDINAAADCTAVAVQAITERGLNISCTGNASTSIGNLLGVHLLCEAKL